MEKNMKYIYIYVCVCVKLNHFVVHQKLTQHCKSTILKLQKRFQLLVFTMFSHYFQKLFRIALHFILV